MEIALFVTGSLSLLIWLYFIFIRGSVWRSDPTLDPGAPKREDWPGVIALIATSDDAEAIVETLPGLLGQGYPGSFHVLLVAIRSRDGTGAMAQRVAAAAGDAQRLSVLTIDAPPAGWSHRAWVLAQAQEHAAAKLPTARYFWVTEPWVEHSYCSLRDLVAEAEENRRPLVSLLPLSSCETEHERILAPAFAFFRHFQLFSRSDDPPCVSAAVSPGCTLIAANALKAAGGFSAFKGALVPEAAVAAEIDVMARRNGQKVWLGLGSISATVRPGDEWKALRRVNLPIVEAQLRKSPKHLAVSTIAIALACLAPPIVFLWAIFAGLFLDIDQFMVTFLAVLAAGAAWGCMSFAAWPTFKLYGQEEWHTLLLPLALPVHLLIAVAVLPKLLMRRDRPRRRPARLRATALQD